MKDTSQIRALEFSSGRGQPGFGIYTPDTVTPWQYLKTLRRLELNPEMALVLAILEDAVHDFQKNIFARYPKDRALYRDAEDWFMDDSNWGIFSFVNVCEVLELSPSYLRKGLSRWKDQQSQAEIKRRV